MFDFTLQQLLLRLAAILLITAVHGYVLTLVARSLGDRGPEYDGRLTLNPVPHLDVIGTLTLLFFSLGWIKPIAVDPQQLRKPRRDLMILTVAGLSATIAFALMLRFARPIVFTTLPDSLAFGTVALLNTTVTLSTWFVILNALPLLPLTGGYLLLAIQPVWLEPLQRYELVIKLILGLLIVTGVAAHTLSPIYQIAARYIQGN